MWVFIVVFIITVGVVVFLFIIFNLLFIYFNKNETAIDSDGQVIKKKIMKRKTLISMF